MFHCHANPMNTRVYLWTMAGTHQKMKMFQMFRYGAVEHLEHSGTPWQKQAEQAEKNHATPAGMRVLRLPEHLEHVEHRKKA
jgi:hypothetical protein